MTENKNFGRKKFLGIIGLGAGVGLLSSILPVKFFNSRIHKNHKVTVNIHPSAIKRNNKV